MAKDKGRKSDAGVLLDDIKLYGVTLEQFQGHLEKYSREKVESWKDANGMHLLHHAILESNFVVVSSLFSHDYFKPPHEAQAPSWPYLHLAAALGQRTIISMLLQERPYDNRPQVLDWDLFQRVIAPKIYLTKPGTSAQYIQVEEKDRLSAILPLEVAARFGHLACVKTFLDFHMTSHTSSNREPRTLPRTSISTSYMNMACKLDCPYALRLLLSDSPGVKEAENALDISLKLAKTECVDALLRHKVDPHALFGGMNLFHVLFAYSKSFEESCLESLAMVTSVLLRHGIDVNACRPSRTFPLYSLLRFKHIINMEKSAPVVLATLLMLLQAGADPNFDEVFVEEAVKDEEHQTAFGRRPYCSALHCLVDAADNYIDEVDTEKVAEYLYKCCELLLRHGANPGYVSKYHDVSDSERRGNVLHALLDAGPFRPCLDRSLLMLLLRHGAEPDACVNGRYPLTAFCESIDQKAESLLPTIAHEGRERHGAAAQRNEPAVTSLRGDDTDDVSELPADPTVIANIRQASRLAGFMSFSALQDCENILRVSCSSRGRRSSHIGTRLVLREVEKYTRTVWSLKHFCTLVVWKSCRHHVGNVFRLPVPQGLINIVLDQL